MRRGFEVVEYRRSNDGNEVATVGGRYNCLPLATVKRLMAAYNTSVVPRGRRVPSATHRNLSE